MVGGIEGVRGGYRRFGARNGRWVIDTWKGLNAGKQGRWLRLYQVLGQRALPPLFWLAGRPENVMSWEQLRHRDSLPGLLAPFSSDPQPHVILYLIIHC